MIIRRMAVLLLLAAATQVHAQGLAVFQQGVTELPNGDFYEGVTDTEFRAANPTEPQDGNVNLSIDQFDGGFQTQGAIRFEHLLVSEGGLVPDELTPDQIIFAEFSFWKQSPSASDANIDFNRVLGPDTTSGDIWQAEDTWASLGGDLIPDEAGLLDGDPIARNGVEAAEIPDFQDSPSRFGADEVVLLDPNAGPVLSSLVYTTDQDSEDVFDEAWDGTPEGLQRAIDLAKWRIDVTASLRDWIADTDPNTPGTQPAAPNYGWAITNDTGDGWDFLSSEVGTPDEAGNVNSIEGEFEGLDITQFRPALTIIYEAGDPLDLNSDDMVDLADFDTFLDLLGGELDGPLATGSLGDFDFNRTVDLVDFKYFKENFPGGVAGFEAALAARSVPEPSSHVLAGIVVLAISLIRRRRA